MTVTYTKTENAEKQAAPYRPPTNEFFHLTAHWNAKFADFQRSTPPTQRLSDEIPWGCHIETYKDWMKQQQIKLNPSRTYRKTFTGGQPRSLKPDAALSGACADPHAFKHAEACEVRDAWKFKASTKCPFVILPKNDPAFADNQSIVFSEGVSSPTGSSHSEQSHMMEDKQAEGVLQLLSTVLVMLNRGNCPRERNWANKAAKLGGLLAQLEERFYASKLPALLRLADGLAIGGIVDDVRREDIRARWQCAYDEVSALKSSLATQKTNYGYFLMRLIADLSTAEDKCLVVRGGKDCELLAAEILSFANSLAFGNKRIREAALHEDAASEFAFRIVSKVRSGELTGDLKPLIAHDWMNYFARDFMKRQDAKKHRVLNQAMWNSLNATADSRDEPETYEAYAEILLATESESGSEDTRKQALQAAAPALELLSPRVQQLVTMRAEADYAEMAQVLGGTPEGIRKEMKRGIAEAVPYPLKASVMHFRERSHRPVYRRTISFEEMATMLRERLGPSKVEVSIAC